MLGVISLFFISGCATEQETQKPLVISVEEETGVEEKVEVIEQPSPTETAPKVVEINMIARQWEFEPSTITVKKGDKVRLNIRNIDVTHGFAIFEFGVNERLAPGKTTTVEFIADKKGEYIFFCSVQCGKGHSDMKGKLIVE